MDGSGFNAGLLEAAPRADPGYVETLAIHGGGTNRLSFQKLEHVHLRKSRSTFPEYAPLQAAAQKFMPLGWQHPRMQA